MSRFQGQYRTDSIRLCGYDYATGGWYHLVICTKDRRSVFGTIRNGVMGLSAAGCIAHRAWPDTVARYDRAVADEFVVMPNHVHLILGLTVRSESPPGAPESAQNAPVETCPGASLRRTDTDDNTNPRSFGTGLRPGSVSSIINHYKGRVTKRIRQAEACPTFAWQPRYYDRIIRNRRELQAHRRYVYNNPVNWTDDRNHPTQGDANP